MGQSVGAADMGGREGSGTRPLTVLVVDDEQMIRTIVGWILRRKGYEVVEAPDGEAGLERFDARNDIDLVLSDVMMPKLDGVSMVRALRERRPTLPVLFMSAYTGNDRPVLDGDDLRLLLSKPFTPDVLIARVQQVLSPAR
jgi:two-component system cell cycle sensor histidine kinase/response regulator CckA